MEGNPRVAYMLEHGELPHWVTVDRQRREQAGREARRIEEAWAEAHTQMARRGRHRAPRRWRDWPAVAVSAALLRGQAFLEAMGEGTVLTGGVLT